jgi:squalene-hopene/tetraprenyl-beta-curcumene cyclase
MNTLARPWSRLAGLAVMWTLTLLPLLRADDAPYQLDPAIRAQGEAALQRGAAYLIGGVKPNGSWGDMPHPAISGLAAMALAGVRDDNADRQATIDKAMDYLLSCKQEDGSIYPAHWGQQASAHFPNYTTSIALMAMAAINKPEYLTLMQKARAYLKSAQFSDPESANYGGLGYGRTGRADLSNASWASEALYVTEYLDREPFTKDPEAEARNKEMWQRFATFLTKCQNLAETNPGDQVSDHPADSGGFSYMPTDSKAGTRPDPKDNVPNLVSSGSMTYAGLKSMIYARLSRQDARVQGAIDYARRHFTVDENPGQGQQAYYFYLYVMARALETYGVDLLTLDDGTKVDWRAVLIPKLVAVQKANGSWWNDRDARFMESIPDLTTPYAMLGLAEALGQSPFAR